jgi:hypothetical protein
METVHIRATNTNGFINTQHPSIASRSRALPERACFGQQGKDKTRPWSENRPTQQAQNLGPAVLLSPEVLPRFLPLIRRQEQPMRLEESKSGDRLPPAIYIRIAWRIVQSRKSLIRNHLRQLAGRRGGRTRSNPQSIKEIRNKPDQDLGNRRLASKR